MNNPDFSSHDNNGMTEGDNDNASDNSSLNHLHCFLCKCSDPNYLVYSPNDNFYLCTNSTEKHKGSHLLYVLEKYGSVPLEKVIYSKTILPISNESQVNENISNNNETEYYIIDSEKNQKIKYTLHKEKYLQIQCQKCKNNNIFDLGFYRKDKNKKCETDDENSNLADNGNLTDIKNIQESLENLICIQCLLKEFGSKNKIIRSFNPIISYYNISDLIANHSADKSMIYQWVLPDDEFNQQIKTLRELRHFKNIEVDQYKLKPLKLHYKNPLNYLNALYPFINEEENFSNKKTQSEQFPGIKIEVAIEKTKSNIQKTYEYNDLREKDFDEFSFYASHLIYIAMAPGSRVIIRLKNSKNTEDNNDNDKDNILGLVISRDPITSYITIIITQGSIKIPQNPTYKTRNIKVPTDEDDTKLETFTIHSFIESVDIFPKPTSIPFTRQRDALNKFKNFMQSKKFNFFIKIMSGDLSCVNTLINGNVEPFIKSVDNENSNKKEEEEDKNEEEEENNDEKFNNEDNNNEENKIENDNVANDNQFENNITKLIESIYQDCQLKTNDDQFRAIKFALMHKFAMIQGPPGTGKSTCIALQALLYYMMGQKSLIITHSNAASDHITEIILNLISIINRNRKSDNQISDKAVVRVCGSTYEIIAKENRTLKKILSCNLAEDPFRYRENNKGNHHLQKIFIRNNTGIYIATAITSGGSRFETSFKNVIVDESNQLVDTELLVPLAHKCEQLTLYGDHKQIGPFVYSNLCKQNNFALSFIERLSKLGYKPICLETQYRMHPQIADFPSKAFYGGRLKDGVKAEDRLFEADQDLLVQKEIPIVFYNVKNSVEQFSSSGKSYLNVAEASALGEIISKFKKSVPAIQPEQIAIITFYNGMIDILRNHLRYLASSDNDSNQNSDSFYDNLRIDTVDAFEGSDINYVILVCVRSNKKKNIGFLNDLGRLNVALTRARKALFIIGNKENFANNEIWTNLIDSLSHRNVVCDI